MSAKNIRKENLNRKTSPHRIAEVSNIIKDVSNVVKEFSPKHINKKE
ncbi:hypothetical protein NRK67_03270 [Fusobacteria bacterium ZRK30]|nr:hypothetical protein NRK67_03270 [Fusobacteria bacterium ZRK30]